MKITHVALMFGLPFFPEKLCIKFDKLHTRWATFWAILKKASGHTGATAAGQILSDPFPYERHHKKRQKLFSAKKNKIFFSRPVVFATGP
jgi:hypothetical protein